ncbi:MAG: hypothetical protein AAF959_22035 [Cyanobacteria bacterium P01_D01_bin.56]
MNRFLSFLGVIALVIAGLWVARLAIGALDDVLWSMTRWMRWRVLPGIMWTIVLGALFYGATQFFGRRG